MVYVTSDWHGYPLDKIMGFLSDVGFSKEDYLFVLGDVIDRGRDGVEALKWLLVQPNVQMILGNHEQMMLTCDFVFDEITEESLAALEPNKLRLLHAWQANGGGMTLAALAKTDPETRADILEYLREAPLYETVHVGGRDFLLVHGGLEGFREDKALSEYTENELLWARPSRDTRYSEQFTTVLGHTPTCYYGRDCSGRALKTRTWINVDTGAACGLSPMLLRLDDLQEFYIKD